MKIIALMFMLLGHHEYTQEELNVLAGHTTVHARKVEVM